MAVYVIVDIRVHDPVAFSGYLSRVSGLVEKNHGRYLVRGGAVTPLLGEWDPDRIVVIEFPTREDVERCFGSHEYQEIRPLRNHSSTGSMVMVEGVHDET